MLNAYFKFVQQSDFTFFCFAKFCELFLSIFNDFKFFLKISLASMKTTFFLESIFCALSNKILLSLLL